MKQLLEEAKLGTHTGCKDCPWNPRTVGPISFGESCEEHGVSWSAPGNAVSMQIVQDPAGTTPEKTGRLCFVHNSKNLSDKTAQHAYDLWKATVSFDNNESLDPFLKNHYWTNALLHGADKNDPRKLRKSGIMEKARKCCKQLLHEQIKSLSPKVILANGECAAKSLYEIGFISSRWEDFKQEFAQRPYKEIKKLSSGESVIIFCTFHTAITPINTHIAKLYSPRIQSNLDERLDKYKSYPKVASFLNNYSSDNATGKGMRVLLLHWVDIGRAIRDANK